MNSLSRGVFAGLVLLSLLVSSPSSAKAGNAIGPRAGYECDSDRFVLGVEAELGRAFQDFRFAPSLDFELGDNSITAFNADFRLYLFRLPETGLRFYGSVGPTILLSSFEGKNDRSRIGLSLVAGMKIPMKNNRRYNLEARFGFGDIPELKLMVAVLFGL
jgi:hypothetical protein